MLEHVFVLQGGCVSVFFFLGMCFFNCLEGTGIEGTPIWREVFGCKIGCGEQFVADEKTDPRQHSLNDYHPAGKGYAELPVLWSYGCHTYSLPTSWAHGIDMSLAALSFNVEIIL